MKKHSVVVTVLLVITLIMAVSCHDTAPILKATLASSSDANVALEVGEGSDKLSATRNISLELKDDKFNATKLNPEGSSADVSSWFVSSDKDKVTFSASVSSFEEGTLVISLKATAVAVTEANKPVTVSVKIPEKGGWTTSNKAIECTTDLAVTVAQYTPSAKEDVTVAFNPTVAPSISIEDAAQKTQEFTATVTGGSWLSESGDVASSNIEGLPTDSTVKYVAGSKNTEKRFTITISANANAQASSAFTIKLGSLITPDNTHKIPDAGISYSPSLSIKPVLGDISGAFTATVGDTTPANITKDIAIKLLNDTFNGTVVTASTDVKTWFTSADDSKVDIKTAVIKSLDVTKKNATVTLTIEPKVAGTVKISTKIPTVTDASKKWISSNIETASKDGITATISTK